MALQELLLEGRQLTVEPQRRPLTGTIAEAAQNKRVFASHTFSDDIGAARLGRERIQDRYILVIRSSLSRARSAFRSRWRRGSGTGTAANNTRVYSSFGLE